MTEQITAIAALPKCLDCMKPIRPGNTKVADWPGTVIMGMGGKCGRCRLLARRAEAAGKPVHRAADYGVPVVMPRVPSVAETMAARRRNHKPRIGRWLIAGKARWWVGVPGLATFYVDTWGMAVVMARMHAVPRG